VRTAAHRLFPIFAVLSLTLFASCSVWDSFTAYFNTYYNAGRLYAEAEDEVWTMQETKETGHNLLTTFNISAGTKAKFAAVIEKCSKLLQYHPDAGLVDDALMMIGKSYYYENEYQKAERKFHEVIDTYPNSDFVLEAQVLIAYCQYKSGQNDEAMKTAQAVLEKATEKGKMELVGEASLVIGQVALDQKAYDRARVAFVRVGEYGDSSEKRVQALMKVADIFIQQKDYASAEQAYRKSYSLSNTYLGEYRASIGVARMLVKQKRFDEADRALASLRANGNYREFFGTIEFEVGNLYKERGDTSRALSQYAYVDTAYNRTEAATDAALALATLYEIVLCKYDSARAVLEAGSRNAVNTAASRDQIVRKLDYITKYINYRNDIIRLDSARYATLHPPDTLSAPRDTSAAPRIAVKTDTVTTARPDTTKPAPPKAPPLSLDTIHVRLAQRMDDIAGLFYATMGVRDSARFWYKRLLNEYPESKGAPRALYVLARVEEEDSTGSQVRADSLFNEIVRRFPDSPFGEEAKRRLHMPVVAKVADPAEASYVKATSLLQTGMNTAAIDSFRAIVRRTPTSPMAPRAMYAIGWTYENHLRQYDSAGAVYERLAGTYPGSLYAQRVQPRVTEIRNAREALLHPKKADSTATAPATAPATGPEVKNPPPPAQSEPDIKREPPQGRRPPPPKERLDRPDEFIDDRVAY
jgi:TolA-binding protein